MPVFKGCFTPSDLWPDGSQGSADFGRLAEVPIGVDFVKEKKCTPLADAYFDTPAVSLYITFLTSNNPKLRTPSKQAQPPCAVADQGRNAPARHAAPSEQGEGLVRDQGRLASGYPGGDEEECRA
jgi:hypothetical protein